MDTASAEPRVAHTLVLAILGELRANPRACHELRVLLNERQTDDRLLSLPRRRGGWASTRRRSRGRLPPAGFRGLRESAATGALNRPAWRSSPSTPSRQRAELSRACARMRAAVGRRTRFGPAVRGSEKVASPRGTPNAPL